MPPYLLWDYYTEKTILMPHKIQTKNMGIFDIYTKKQKKKIWFSLKTPCFQFLS